jgi:hypothetical protein
MFHFISFCEGTQTYKDALHRISNQAKSLNLFNVETYTGNDLKEDTSFWEKNGTFVLNNQRGYGYWLWKPYLILKKLQSIKENEIILYCDCGCEIDIRKKNKIEQMLKDVETCEIICNTTHGEIAWTKRDLLIYLNMDNENVLKQSQYEATSICIKKCEKTMKFVQEWYETACIHNLLDDSPSENTNYPQFIEHRHDQSIFSLLKKKYYDDNGIRISTIIELSRNRSGNSNIRY